VLTRTGIPAIDPARYQFLIHGMVDRPTSFSLDDLKRFPSVSRIMFLECNGNTSDAWQGAKPESTLQQLEGLTGTSEWTGVPVATLFNEVGIGAGASWALAEGSDAGALARSIPVGKLLAGGLSLRLTPQAGADQPARATPTPGVASSDGRFGFGQPATAAQIAAENIDVRPDGTGLPPGSGTAAQGQAIYSVRCASCHGDTGREGGTGPILVDLRPFQPGVTPRTVGNYWPYATTVYDYVNRAMPPNAPASLQPDEVYALVAYLLNANEIIAPDAVMNAQTLPRVAMPNVTGFIPDPRPDVP
jgi:cytochrome c